MDFYSNLRHLYKNDLVFWIFIYYCINIVYNIQAIYFIFETIDFILLIDH